MPTAWVPPPGLHSPQDGGEVAALDQLHHHTQPAVVHKGLIVANLNSAACN